MNIWKNKFIYEKINVSVERENSINQKSNNTTSLMLCTGATFVNENSCLLARIVSFDTAGLHVLIFHNLEPYSEFFLLTHLSTIYLLLQLVILIS